MPGTYQIVRNVKYGPQAKDDAGSGSEDYSVLIDILANDLASNANEPWSLDQDNPANFTAEGTVVTLASGATIRFEDGVVVYDPNGSFDYLAQGQEATDSFTYAIRMSNGVVSYATVTVTVVGENDGPVAIADVATATEDGSIIAGNVGSNDSDADNGASLSFALDSAAPAGLTFGPDGSWSFDPSDPAYQDLAEGQTLDVVVAYTVTDDTGATAGSTLTITVTGTNDAPVANADVAAGLQNDTLTIDVLGNDTDVDQGAALTVVDASAPDGQGGVSIVDNQLVFEPGGDFDYLSEGQTTTVTIGYTIADEHGALSSSTVTVTVTGTNEGPAIGAGDFTGAVLEAEPVAGIPAGSTPVLVETGDANDLFANAQLIDRADLRIADNANLGDDSDPSISVQGSINSATDQDVYAIELQPGETITLDVDFGLGYGSTAYSGYGSIPGLDAFISIYDADGNLLNLNDDAPTGAGGAGSIYVQDSYLQFTAGSSGTYYVVVHDYNDLGAMSQGPYTLQVSVDSQSLQITDSGVFSFSDTDLADSHSVTVTADGEGYLGTLTAGVDDAATGDGEGTVRWDFSVANAAVQYLAEGQTLVQSYTVAVSDGQGGTAEETVTVTITGTNDAPVISTALSIGDILEDSALSTSGQVFFNDVDLADGHNVTSVADGDGYYGTFSASLADSSTGDGSGEVEWTFNVDNAEIQHLGAGEWLVQHYTITIDDGHGGTTQQLVNVTLTGTNDGPVLSAGGEDTGAVAELANNVAGENATLHMADGSFGFTDADVNDGHSISSITPAGDGYYGALTAEIDPSTREVNWSFSVDDSAIDGLEAGETLTQTYTIEVADGEGATVSRDVTVTITGAGDNTAPNAVDDLNLVASAVGNSSFSATPDFSGWTVNTALSPNFINIFGAPFSSAYISRTPDGDGVATLTFSGYINQPGGNGYGPTITSDSFTANAGDVVSFDWLLSSGSDYALGTGVLIDAVTGAVVATVFNYNTGFSGSTGWRHTDVTVATSGTFVMEFRVGSYDSTFGQAVGATMQLDFAGVLPQVHEDAALTIQTAQLLENDTDADGDALSVTDVSAVSTLGASVVLNGDGTITYDPTTGLDNLAAGESAEDSFTYTISDGNGGTDTATVTLTVAGRNDAPDAVGDVATGDENQILAVNVLANDSDVDHGATLSLVNASAPDGQGSVSIDNNQLVFDPGADFDYLEEGETATVSVDYTIQDEHGAQSTATLTVTVTGSSDGPPWVDGDFQAAFVTGGANPWGSAAYTTSMNTAFGAGEWDALHNPSGNIFDDGYDFVWLDGGDGQTDWFEAFVNEYRDEMEDYVEQGGTLYINAARWDGAANFDLGFGVHLTNNGFANVGTATGDAGDIVNGPNGYTGTSWSGGYFAHDYVTGDGLTALITGNGSQVALAEMDFGEGHVLFGGITSSAFHSPGAQAAVLEANILDHAASFAADYMVA